MFGYIILGFGLICSTIGLIISISTDFNPSPPPPPNITPPPSIISLGSVSDLIQRLKPLIKNPEGRWYNTGLKIEFSTNEVKIELETLNGNKYVGRASTLEQAVSRITEPSNEIKSVLKGWKE